ncbi:hypothetical protein niasHT_031929 [Heterodera trifolii]|uniref:Uncharacterized protein n=1 Tax=Heterodera trifolii TaxID=157864 RepID=A0ABD2I2Z2_9BILA
MASFLLKFVLFISFLVLFCDCNDTDNEGETDKKKAVNGGPKENTKEGDQISDAKKGVRKDLKNLHIGENLTPHRLKAKKEVFKNKTPKRGKAVEKDVKKEVHV